MVLSKEASGSDIRWLSWPTRWQSAPISCQIGHSQYCGFSSIRDAELSEQKPDMHFHSYGLYTQEMGDGLVMTALDDKL